MPLFGKIVVIKRNGTDGTEFPLTASCLFGRKLDCDIRIQLPQVSKEHCRIELNENKELILTNLSSVNPTRINGEVLKQSERLRHGDLITIIDRSFRFEYPPAPTPKKKRLSTPGKAENVKVLQDQQVRSTPGTTEKNKSEHVTETCLKDGSNISACLDQTFGDQQNKTDTSSPFSDLYNMVKRDLASKPVWKSASLSNTPVSRAPAADKPESEKVSDENDKPVTPKSAKKKRRSSTAKPVQCSDTENPCAQVKTATPVVQEQKKHSEGVGTPVSQKKTFQTTPQKYNADQVAQQIVFESPSTKSPKVRRRSSASSQSPLDPTTSQKSPSESTVVEEPAVKQATRTSPRENAGKRFHVQEVLATPTSVHKGIVQVSSKKHKCDDLPLPVPKRKRVSFGGQLSPELFDKRLPPDSPLRRGATPGRRSLGSLPKLPSLLRRASTIGLMDYRLEEDIVESPASLKGIASPARAPKTPSPAKKSLSPKAKSPSPKNSKSPSPSSKPSTPKSSRRLSNASVKLLSPSEESGLKTPTMHGRFSVSRISTPSPVPEQEKELKQESLPVVEEPRERMTPRAISRRSSMKASARKSALKSALSVVRSRRSGASCANLKVVSSWADIVKFGQPKPQTQGCTKTTTAKRRAKQTKVTKSKTPARKQKDHTSTGHADSPASIVVGKAHLRSIPLVGAAPKVVRNVALFKKDMEMDEDLIGVSDIFKTSANIRRKSALAKVNDCPATPLVEMTEMSVMKTPEEPGEMVVSPMSVAPTTNLGRYNNEAITRLLQDSQDGSVMEEMYDSTALPSAELSTILNMTSNKTVPVQTPQLKPTLPECLTGIRRLMRTPKQKSEPVEDLKLGLDGVKELFNSPEPKGSPSEEDIAGLQSIMKSPKGTNSPLCSVALKRPVKTPKNKLEEMADLPSVKHLKTLGQKKEPVEEDLTGIQQMMKTPNQKKQPVEEDLVGIKEMMKTPKQKKQPVEEDLVGIKKMMKMPKQKKQPVEEDLMGIKEMMKTPKQKKQPVEEDLMGIKEMMKTPKQKKQPVEEDLMGIKEMMKTPNQKKQPVEEDLVGIKEEMKTPKQKKQPVEEDLGGIKEMMKTPKQKKQPVEEDLAGIKEMMKTPKQKKQPVEEDLVGIKEMMKTPKLKKQPVEEDLTGVKEMMETPKQKKQLDEEDLTGVKEEMKTPKQKKQPVEEDLVGIKEMMKTPKQEKQPVEDLVGIKEMMKTPKQEKQPVEDLVGIKEMMKTPKQKKQPVEDLVRVKTLLKTPKEKGESVENDFGTDTLMKTRKQKGAELNLEDSVLPVEDVSEDSEVRENICLVVDVKNNVDAEYSLQIEMEEVTSCEVITNSDKDVQETPLEITCTAVSTSIAVEATQPVASSKQTDRSSFVKRTRHGVRVQTTPSSQKNQEHKVDSDSLSVAGTEEEPCGNSANAVPSVRGTRGTSAVGLLRDVPVQSPARKSTRGRIPKDQVEVQKSVPVSVMDEQVELKPRRGKKAEQDVEILQVGPVTVEVEAFKKSPAPARTKRGKKEKLELENPQQPEALPEASVDVGMASERAELQPSAKTETPVKSNTRARRGKATRKDPTMIPEVEETLDVKNPDSIVESEAVVLESSKIESTAGNKDRKSTPKPRRGRPPKKEVVKSSQVEECSEPTAMIMESDVKASGALVALDVAEVKLPESTEDQSAKETEDPVKANLKPRRGKPAKKEIPIITHIEDVSKPTSDSEVLPEEKLQMLVVKSRRGRRVNPVSACSESSVKPHAVESRPNPEAPVVRPNRSARNKQMKPQVEDSANSPASESIAAPAVSEKPAVEPVVKNGRGGRIKQTKAQTLDETLVEAQDKPSVHSEPIQQSETSAVRSDRGKRTVTFKNEPETPVKRGRREGAVEIPPLVKPSRGRKPASKQAEREEIAQEAVEPIKEPCSESTLLGSVTDEKALAHAGSEGACVNSEAKRGRGRITKKAKVLTKNTLVSKAENEAAEEEPQQNTSKKKDEPAAEDDPSVAESKQLVHQSVKGRKGRGAKTQEVSEKTPPAPEEKVQPVRRGRAGASVVSQHEVTTCPRRGQKRKVTAEETPNAEPLLTRKRGRGAGTEDQTDAPQPTKVTRTRVKEAEETSDMKEEEAPKKEEKPVRGRRKVTQEDVRPQAVDPVSEMTTRRGARGQKKAQADVPSAPARRTRRK